MALQIIFQYQHSDATSALNRRLARLIGPGIYYGGTLSYSAGATSAQRSPLLAVGYDGVTVADDASSTVAFTTSGTFYVVIRAKYNASGSPATPTISEETMTAAQYAADPDVNYLIRVASVTCAAGGVISSVSYTIRDVVDAVGRDSVRGVVTAIADLPTPTPTTNRLGDCYFVTNEEGYYYWTGSAWSRTRAAGAGSRQGAYDDDGAAGSGRTVNVNAQAVLDVQSSATQRANDIANAARRIDKTGSSITGGDVGEDVKIDGNRDFASYLARTRYTNGADVQANEAITLNAGGDTVTLTRPTNMDAADGYHCQLVEITGTTNNQDGLYFYTRTGVAAGTLKNLDNTSPVLAADTGTANFYTIRFLVGSHANRPSIFSVRPGMVTYPGDFVGAADCAHLQLIQNSGMIATQYLRKVVDIDTGTVIAGDYLYFNVHTTFSDIIEAKNYMDDGAGFQYQSGSEVEKWIWPTWESCSSQNFSVPAVPYNFYDWYFTEDGASATAELGYWRCSSVTGARLSMATADWPEGMSLRGVELDWNAVTLNTDLRMYVSRQRWDAAGARTCYNLFAAAYQTPGGVGRRKDTFTPTHNYGPGAAGTTTDNWTHGGSVVAQTSDRLCLLFATQATNTLIVYGIRLKVRYRSINKWDGNPVS